MKHYQIRANTKVPLNWVSFTIQLSNEATSTRIRINVKTQKYLFIFREFRVHT